MAQKLITIDDVTGEEGAEEIIYGWQGKFYRIDLAEEGRVEFERDMAPWLQFSTPVDTKDASFPSGSIGNSRRSGSSRRGATPDDTGRHSPEEIAACRGWAESNRIKQHTGRIPTRMWAAWRTGDKSYLRPDDFLDGEPSGLRARMTEALEQKAS